MKTINFYKILILSILCNFGLFTNMVFSYQSICPDLNLTIQIPDTDEKNSILLGRLTNRELFIGNSSYDYKRISVSLKNKGNVLYLDKNQFIIPTIFKISNRNRLFQGNVSWEFIITNSNLKPVHKFEGEGEVPKEISWHNTLSIPGIRPNASYFYFLKIKTLNGNIEISTRPRSFRIYAPRLYKHNILTKDIYNYPTQFNQTRWNRIHSKISANMKKYSNRRWFIRGYVTQKTRTTCDSLELLKEQLSFHSAIPLNKIQVSCTVFPMEVIQGKHVTIIGARPGKKIKLFRHKVKNQHTITLGRHPIYISREGLFQIDETTAKQYQTTTRRGIIKLESKFGETLSINIDAKKHVFELHPGENNINKMTLNLTSGKPKIFCGKPFSFPAINLNASLGIGPYMISDAWDTPGDFHLLAYHFTVEKHINSFVPRFELATVPVSLSGAEDSNQSFYHINFTIGYNFDFSTWSISPTIGYLLYFSDNSTFKGRNVISKIGFPVFGLSLNIREFLIKKLDLEYNLKVSPTFFSKDYAFGTDNSFTFFYYLLERTSLMLGYRKNFFMYKFKTHDTKYIENIDWLFTGISYKY